MLKSPDLFIPKYKYFPQGLGLDLQVDVENRGSWSSRATTVHTVVQIFDVSGTLLNAPLPIETYVPDLQHGDRRRLGVDYLDVSAADTDGDGTRDIDFDLFTMGIIDGPTTTHPDGLNIELGGEGNNQTTETCRVYSPDSGPWNYTNPPVPCD